MKSRRLMSPLRLGTKPTTSSGSRNRVVQYSKIDRRSSAAGQNENSPILGLCQLLPSAPDIGLQAVVSRCSNLTPKLLDNLVGALLKEQRHIEAKRLRGL